MENLLCCPACGSDATAIFLSARDHLVTHRNFYLRICHNCGLRYTSPRPDAEEIGAYYQNEAYVSHSDTQQGLINRAYAAVRTLTLRQKRNLLEQLHHSEEPRRLLDIGCGTGYFLESCQQAGWEVVGTEPDANARTQAQARTGQTIWPDLTAVAERAYFRAITLWHVLEHVHDLQATLAQIAAMLHPAGVLLIAVPNPESADADYYQQDWAALDVPRHLYHFTPAAMTQLLARHGLAVLEKRPMAFDGFYVSWLSEQHRGRSLAPVRGFWQGLGTWLSSRSDVSRSSSLLYVVRRCQ